MAFEAPTILGDESIEVVVIDGTVKGEVGKVAVVVKAGVPYPQNY